MSILTAIIGLSEVMVT